MTRGQLPKADTPCVSLDDDDEGTTKADTERPKADTPCVSLDDDDEGTTERPKADTPCVLLDDDDEGTTERPKAEDDNAVSSQPDHEIYGESSNNEESHVRDTINVGQVPLPTSDNNAFNRFPNDPKLFSGVSITPNVVRQILEMGPCQPNFDANDEFSFPRTHGRGFRREWYFRHLKDEKKKVPRKWLIYSPSVDSLFCLSCWLFAKTHHKHYDPTWSTVSGSGFSNWKKATLRIEQHEKSSIHMEAEGQLSLTRLRLDKGKAVDAEQVRAYECQVQKNRKVVSRLIDVTLFLAKQNLALRGHRENMRTADTERNDGNFLELVRLISKYDSVLAAHLSEQTSHAMYLSPRVQNELIQCLRNSVESVIMKEVHEAGCFTIIADSAIDISHTDLLSISLRYVASDGDVVERFICFQELPSTKSSVLFEQINECAKVRNISLKDCVGQAYDGAANMSGSLSGLQQRIKEVSNNPLCTLLCT